MQFAAHWPLWLLLALAPLAWMTWRHRRRASRRRLWSAFALRAAALTLTALALMRPSVAEPDRALSVIYAVDISRSVAAKGVEEALRWIERTAPRGEAVASHVVLFADRARVVDTPPQARELAVSASAAAGTRDVDGRVDDTGAGAAIAQDATNLEDAMLAALDTFPPAAEKHLVLISDGNQTAGDVTRALPRLARDRVHVYPIPARLAVEVDAWPEALHIDPARVDQQVTVRADLFSRTAVEAQVSLEVNGAPVASLTMPLQPGRNEAAFNARFHSAGANRLALQVRARGDEVPANDRIEQSVWVQPRPRVLYAEGNTQSAHYLADALRRQSIEVKPVTGEQLAANPGLLNETDVIVLSDISATQLGTAGDHIERFVRDRGGGLVFAAGEQTYGKEGYAGSPLERILPVTFEGKRKKRDLDLVLLIDRSYSMRGRKLELAKTAALATLDLLDETHRLAVIGFDMQAREVVPLGAVGNKRRAEDLIASMTASGQTSLYPALLKAQQLLAESTAATRHVILLSDGITQPVHGRSRSSAEEVQAMIRDARADVVSREGATFDSTPAAPALVADDAFAQIAQQFKDAKITLTTIAVGEKPNKELMDNLADWSGGKHYAARDDSEIPSLFMTETQRLLGASIVEHAFRPRVKSSGAITDGIDFAAAPPLKGFVIARPKRFSEVLLEAQKDKPLLARTQYGLGTTVAFLSDVKNRWAADWLDWPGYARLWAQVVRGVLPREADLLHWDVERRGNEAAITLRALDASLQFRGALTPRVQVTRPGGARDELTLRQVAPGHYAAHTWLAPATAATAFALLPVGGLTARETDAAGPRDLFYATGDEDRVHPADVPLLRMLAERTGGVYAPAVEQILARRDAGGQRQVEIWQYLTIAALLAWLLDVLVRRLNPSLPHVIAKRTQM